MKVMKWLVMNGIMCVSLWFGLVNDVAGARNVGLFMVWVLSVMSIFLLSRKFVEEFAKQSEFPSVPASVDNALNFAVLLLLAWHGCWASSAAWVFHSVVCCGLYAKVKELRAEAGKS